MQFSRLTRNLTIVLLLSSVLNLIPAASSQQLTTTTSFLTTASTETITSLSESYYNTTETNTQTVTTSANFLEFLPIAYGTSGCWSGLMTFNSTGNNHETQFVYTASASMTIYLADFGSVATYIAAAPLSDCQPVPHSFQRIVSSYIYPTSGNFSLSLPMGTYGIISIAPLAASSPTLTMVIEPVLATQILTQTLSFTLASTQSSTATQTFLTTLEVPFVQTYGDWIVAIIVVVLVFGVLLVLANRKAKQ